MDFSQARENFFKSFDATVDAFDEFFNKIFDALDAFAEGVNEDSSVEGVRD